MQEVQLQYNFSDSSFPVFQLLGVPETAMLQVTTGFIRRSLLIGGENDHLGDCGLERAGNMHNLGKQCLRECEHDRETAMDGKELLHLEARAGDF